MEQYYPQKLKKAVLALSLAALATGAPAAYAAPLHDASGNILGAAAKDKSGSGKKSSGAEKAESGAEKAESGAEKPAKPAPEKKSSASGAILAPETESHHALLDENLRQDSLRPTVLNVAYKSGAARAYKVSARKTGRSRLGAAKRAEILGSAPARRSAPVYGEVYPQAEIVSYHPSLIIGGRPYSILIHKLALKYDMPEDLIHAVVHTESNYNYRLRGGVGEIGLMQIRPETARMLGYTGTVRGLYEPAVNLEYGTRYLALARYLSGGSLCGTVLKYNAGHGAKRMNPISYRYCKNVKSYLYAVGYRY